VLHDDMSYDPIQGQGHGGPKVAKITDFRVYLLRRYACNQKTNVEYDTSTLRLLCFSFWLRVLD